MEKLELTIKKLKNDKYIKERDQYKDYLLELGYDFNTKKFKSMRY